MAPLLCTASCLPATGLFGFYFYISFLTVWSFNQLFGADLVLVSSFGLLAIQTHIMQAERSLSSFIHFGLRATQMIKTTRVLYTFGHFESSK